MTSSVLQRRPGRTVEEREFLMAEVDPPRSAFRPRSMHRLATSRLPRSTVNIECSHFLRSSTDDSAHGHPPVTLQLWREVGKHDPPFAERPDTDYNSNVWRNFRQHCGFYTTTDGQRVNDMIASMYPLSIPPPSRCGEYTYCRFLADTPLIKNPRQRKLAIERARREEHDMKEMGLKSEARNPPLDTTGNIIPPLNFKNYGQHVEPAGALPLPPSPASVTRTDMFGKQVPLPRRGPHPWKLSYKMTNPQFQQLDERIRLKRSDPHSGSRCPPSALTQRPSRIQEKPAD